MADQKTNPAGFPTHEDYFRLMARSRRPAAIQIEASAINQHLDFWVPYRLAILWR
jgi:hypothetical protein